jgi:hypothetical protein
MQLFDDTAVKFGVNQEILQISGPPRISGVGGAASGPMLKPQILAFGTFGPAVQNSLDMELP